MASRKKKEGQIPGEKLTEYRRKRDFTKTAEPSGEAPVRRQRELVFVIQKHAASHLHYDVRLELEGVMKSWAVPKGPSVDPTVKRLAMEVEDHPMAYNAFEGTIPRGEYGGGTVMLWDRGTYVADEAAPGEEQENVLKREYHAGKMSITFHGDRLQGSWAMVRTERGAKPKWLMIKHRDEFARKYEATEEFVTSVTTDRTMDEIAAGTRVWHSNRGPGSGRASGKTRAKAAPSTLAIRPQRPQTAKRIGADDERVYLPWLGGERVLVYATAEACALNGESGDDVTAGHAKIAASLASFAARVKTPFVLDGEIDEEGQLHVLDILFAAGTALAPRPWTERREALEALFRRRRVPHVSVAGIHKSADDLMETAAAQGWRGVIAVGPSTPYTPGGRTRDWLALII